MTLILFCIGGSVVCFGVLIIMLVMINKDHTTEKLIRKKGQIHDD